MGPGLPGTIAIRMRCDQTVARSATPKEDPAPTSSTDRSGSWIPRSARPRRLLRARGLALDDVVHLKHFRLARVDPQLSENRAQALSKRVELLPRIPDLADL